jgi:hypothetical protein
MRQARKAPDRPPWRPVPAVLAMAAAMLLGLAFAWNLHPPDLSALYMAAHLFHEGQDPLVYAAPRGFFGGPAPEWSAALAEAGLAGELVLAYVYPPLWAALLAPLAGVLEPQDFFRGAAVLMTCLVAGSSLVAWRLARGWAMPLHHWLAVSALCLVTSLAVFMAMFQLQPHILVVFLVLLAFERLSARRSGWAGLCLGLAAALKLGPAALALIFLAERDWRALGAFAATLAACAAASLALAGPALHSDFLASLGAAVAGTQITGVTFSVEVLLNAAASLAGLAEPLEPSGRNIRVGETALWLGITGKLAMLALMLWAARATERLERGQRLTARLFLLSLLVGLFGPLGWVFYFLPQVYLLPALVGLLPGALGPRVLVAAAVLTSWPFFAWVGLLAPGDLPRAALGALVMLGLFVAVTLGCRARGRQAGAAAAPGALPA